MDQTRLYNNNHSVTFIKEVLERHGWNNPEKIKPILFNPPKLKEKGT